MKFVIKKELMCGEWHWMIYTHHYLFGDKFFERWNNLESAAIRLKELNSVESIKE